MPKIIMTVGLPASGKSTWAKEQVAKSHGKIKRVNKDDLRALLDAGTWSRDREKFVLKIRDAVIRESMAQGLDIIVDDTNLAPKHINHIKQMVEQHNSIGTIPFFEYTVEVNDSFLEVPYKTCVKRDLARPNSVGEKVIRQMYIQFVLKVEKLEQNKDLPHAIICDLDGTLALFGNKNPYDRDFENDVVNKQVRDVLDMFVHESFSSPHIIFLSGRSDKYKEITEKWISSKAGLPFIAWELHMRKEGDSRSDVIVKKELFDEFVRDKYYVDFVIDDRLQILDLWHSMGLFTFNVNQTNEEF
jgi:predicted kinase